jgi:capsule polysaccharide modification protein KpsS
VRKKDGHHNQTLEQQLQEAYACVTFQSTACVKAVLNGVPSFCDGHFLWSTCIKYGLISNRKSNIFR